MRKNAHILYMLQVNDINKLHQLTNALNSYTQVNEDYTEVIIDMNFINSPGSKDLTNLCNITGFGKDDFDGASFILFHV